MITSQTEAPLFFALCQVKFNVIEDMEVYIPSIQKAMRERGYPDFIPETQVELQVNTGESGHNAVRHQEHKRWLFKDIDQQSAFVLLKDQIVYQTTAYSSFEIFSQSLLDGVELINNLVGLAYFDRIGLRYLDAIIPDQSNSYDDLMHPGQLALHGKIQGEIRHGFTETVSGIEGGTLVARSLVTKQGVVLPPDLHPLQLELPSRFKLDQGSEAAVLDIDYFKQERVRFNLEGLRSQLDNSHRIAKETFELATTEKARRQVWKL